MKTAAKTALIVAAAFILVGLCMIFGGMALNAKPDAVAQNIGGGFNFRIDSHGVHFNNNRRDDDWYDDRYDDRYEDDFEDRIEDWLEENPDIDADFSDIF